MYIINILEDIDCLPKVNNYSYPSKTPVLFNPNPNFRMHN